jgi:hypothetical protein
MSHAYDEIRVLQSFRWLKIVSERMNIRAVSLIKCWNYCMYSVNISIANVYQHYYILQSIEIAETERSKYSIFKTLSATHLPITTV